MENADRLIAGYTAYTDAQEIGPMVEGQAPATSGTTTPVCLTIATTIIIGC
ncbi:LxmA leader domain family RiPP [Nonomuraea sp. NPDC003707]